MVNADRYMLLCGYPPFYGDCGANCGWKQGKHCEDCAVRCWAGCQMVSEPRQCRKSCWTTFKTDNLTSQSRQAAHFGRDRGTHAMQDWRRVSGAAKELITRMLVSEEKVRA